MNNEKSSLIHSTLWLGICLAIGIISSTVIISNTVTRVKLANQTITVKGYAEKRISSDLIVWKGIFSVRGTELVEAYKALDHDLSLVKEYLVSKGIADSEIVVSSIRTRTIYGRDAQEGQLIRFPGMS